MFGSVFRFKENYEFSYQAYFITPDGITVNGNITRTVNTQNNHYYNTFDQIEGNLGIYRIDSEGVMKIKWFE